MIQGALIVALTDSVGWAQCDYEIVTFGPLACAQQSPVSCSAINNFGHVCGSYSPCLGQDRAFFWSQQSGFVVLNLGPQIQSRAMDLNDSDEVAGWVVMIPNVGRRWFHWKAGVVDIMNPLPPFPPPYTSMPQTAVASGIGPDGTLVGGWGNFQVGPNPLPLTWKPGFAPVSLYDILGYPSGNAEAMNGLGQIAGWVIDPSIANSYRAFLITGRSVTIFPPAPNALTSRATALSSNGRIAGYGNVSLPNGGTTKRAFYWDGNSTVDLGLGPIPSHDLPGLEPAGVNALGQVVGAGTSGRAFLWQNGHLYDVEDLVLDTGSACYLGSSGINDRGQIIVSRFTSEALVGAVLTPIRTRAGDATLDCKVDVTDIMALFEFWGKNYAFPNGPADLDNNGVVDGYDLGIILGDWGD